MQSPKNTLRRRCEVYKEVQEAATKSLPAVGTKPVYPYWWEEVDEINHAESFQAHGLPVPRQFARPGNLISPNLELLTVHEGDELKPYVAVSYVWDQNPVFFQWYGRKITQQALDLARRLSKHTKLPLWIDAICIPQDQHEAKMVELAKMADIYRGAVAVICLVPELSARTSRVVKEGVGILNSESCGELQRTGDVYGTYMFVTQGQHQEITALFGSRWWERAWTFQEAILNSTKTSIVGAQEDTIPIASAWAIASVIRQRAVVNASEQTLGRPSQFWDSVTAMAQASKGTLPLGEAMACVWRRDATVRHDMVYSILGVCGLDKEIIPDYNISIEDALIQLIDAAGARGDFSWLYWCVAIDRGTKSVNTVSDGIGARLGMGMVPTPEAVMGYPFSSVATKWRTAPRPEDLKEQAGGSKGVLLPFRSYGAIRDHSPYYTLEEAVGTLKKQGFSPAQIWDLIFGLQVGLSSDINQAVLPRDTFEGAPGDISGSLLSCALSMIRGNLKVTNDMMDMKGQMAHTDGIGFMSYSVLAARGWISLAKRPRQSTSSTEASNDQQAARLRLVIMTSQGATVVAVLDKDDPCLALDTRNGIARIFMLPLEPISVTRRDVGLAFVTYDAARFTVKSSGMGIILPHAGNGKWQLRRFG